MTKKYQLKNGMTVLLIESHKSPVVAVQMWVKTGSADEQKGIEGISHFIEHLVFKGSEKYRAGEIASAVEGAGGVLNAYTTFDQTVFYVTVSKDFADTGLDVISEMMGHPAFDEDEINREREVVIEEIKRSFDNPRQRGSRLLFSTAYQKHPYGIPVIGFDDNIRRVTKEEILRYYHSRYVPQNMNLVVVGDFNSREMKIKVEEYFGSFKKFKLRPVRRKTEIVQRKARAAIQSAPFAENLIYLSWPIPKIQHKDIPALSVLAQILGQSESSRLNQKIKNDNQLVNSIGASLFAPKDQGFFAISGSLTHENLNAVLNGVRLEIEAMKSVGPTAQELSRAICALESDRFYSMETVDGLASLYGHFELLYNDYKYFDKILNATKKVTSKNVSAVAKKYLQDKKISISYLTGEQNVAHINILNLWRTMSRSTETRSESPIAVKKKNERIQTLKWSPPKQEQPAGAQLTKLKNGARLVTKIIKSSPVVSLRIGFMGGLRYEDASIAGANELLSRVWVSSTKGRSEDRLNQDIDDLASSINAFSGRNSIGLSMTALAPRFDKTLDILEEVLQAPAFDEKIIEREKLFMLEYLRQRDDKPAQQCMIALMSNLFGEHPYGRDPFGSKEHIQKLNAAHLRDFLTPLLSAENMVVSVVGDVDLNSLKKRIENLAKCFQNQKFKRRQYSLSPLIENKYVFQKSAKEQSHIVLAYPGLAICDEDRHALEVMQSVLSGQGGRLFVELRDKESLAYTVSPMRMDGLESGYFGAYIACSPEKARKAVDMMLAEFEKLRKHKIGSDELERAKKYLLGRHDIAQQRTGHVADLMLFDTLYGLPFNDYESFHHQLSSVTSEQIQALAKNLFGRKYVLSLVGREGVEPI